MTLKQGQIVWAWINDEAGRNRKLRPGLILSNTDDILKSSSVFVAAITSTFKEPLPEFKISLPWQRGGHPVTGLKKRCVVVCNWVVRISIDDIEDVAGIVPRALFVQVANIVRKYGSQL